VALIHALVKVALIQACVRRLQTVGGAAAQKAGAPSIEAPRGPRRAPPGLWQDGPDQRNDYRFARPRPTPNLLRRRTPLGIGDAELEGLLVDAGMPRHEARGHPSCREACEASAKRRRGPQVPLLIGKLNDHWVRLEPGALHGRLQASTIDPLL
jgi:hypothetical protein